MTNYQFVHLTKSIEELEIILNAPRVYLSNYFSDLKNEIDLGAAILANFKTKSANIQLQTAEIDTIYNEQTLFINQIESFENTCLNSIQLFELADQTKQTIDLLKLKMIEFGKYLSRPDSEITKSNQTFQEIENAVQQSCYKLQQRLFSNKCLLFLNKKTLKKFGVEESLLASLSIGILLFIQDQFISQTKIKQLK